MCTSFYNEPKCILPSPANQPVIFILCASLEKSSLTNQTQLTLPGSWRALLRSVCLSGYARNFEIISTTSCSHSTRAHSLNAPHSHPTRSQTLQHSLYRRCSRLAINHVALGHPNEREECRRTSITASTASTSAASSSLVEPALKLKSTPIYNGSRKGSPTRKTVRGNQFSGWAAAGFVPEIAGNIALNCPNCNNNVFGVCRFGWCVLRFSLYNFGVNHLELMG